MSPTNTLNTSPWISEDVLNLAKGSGLTNEQILEAMANASEEVREAYPLPMFDEYAEKDITPVIAIDLFLKEEQESNEYVSVLVDMFQEAYSDQKEALLWLLENPDTCNKIKHQLK